MLRWLSLFGALALVAIAVVFYVYGGPPTTLIPGPEVGVQNPPPAHEGRQAVAQPGEAPARDQAGPWTRVLAATPRVVIPGARLTAIATPQVPAMRDGQLLFLGSEIKPGETAPPGAFEQEVSYLVTETEAPSPDKAPPADWVQSANRWYRPLTKRDDVRPNKVRLYREKRWFRLVDEGTQVKEGDLLALVDPSLAVDDLSIKLAKLDAAEADRASSEKSREEYKERWLRADQLYKQGAGSKEDATAAKLGYDHYVYETINKAEGVKVAGKELRQAETILDLHSIRSKINGEVKQLIKRRGEAVHNLETVLEMQDHSKLRIRGPVDLQDLDSLPDPRNPEDKRVVYVEATRMVPPMPHGILTGHYDAVNGVAVSKDNQIISVSEDHTACIWRKDPTGRRDRKVVKHKAAVRAVACTPPALADKNLFLTGAADGVARLFDLAADGCTLVREFTNGHKEGGINSVAFSPDGRWAVSGGDDRAICLWDVDSGALLQRFPGESGHKAGVTSVAFLYVGRDKKLSVASAGRDNALIVWPLDGNGAPERAILLDRRGGEVTTLGVNPNGTEVLFDQGKDLRVVSSEDGSLLGNMSATGGGSFSKLALFSPDGHLVLTSSGAGGLQLWQAPTPQTRGHELQQLVWTSSRDERAVTNCGAFAPDKSFLVTGTQNRTVIVWPMPSPEEVESRPTAKVIALDPEVSSGQVRVTAEMDNPGGRLLPGYNVTLVVYPEK